MLLWLGLAVMTTAVVAALLSPLLRRHEADDASADGTAIYRDQLREIDADHARGALGEAEYRSARTEIARRLLVASDKSAAATGPDTRLAGTSGRSAVALAVAAAVPLSAIAIYLALGAPNLPGQPHSARLKVPVQQARVDELIRTVELRLRQHPEDGQGWDVLAPVYLKQGRYREAAEAFGTAMRLLGETSKRLAGLAEATVLENDGIVTEPARLAYEKLAKLEPARPEPRFWLALAKEQDGQLEAAFAEYDALIKSAGPDAPWVAIVIERQEGLRQRMGSGGPAPKAAASAPKPAPGPTASDVAAAEKMTPADRQQMIEGMVASLAARLKANGRDLAGWERLIRAYTVMGRKAEALAALVDARKTFAGEPTSLSALADLARALGLET